MSLVWGLRNPIIQLLDRLGFIDRMSLQMKCDGASLLMWTLSPWRRGGLLFWQSSSLAPSGCLVAPPAPPGASACATTANEHVNHVSTTLAWPECTQINLIFLSHCNKYWCFPFQEREDFLVCQSAWKPCSRGISQSWRRRRTFQTHSFIYSVSKLASQCIGKRKGEEKGAFSSGGSARGHVSGVICIWMETFSPELKEKIQFITVAWEIPQVQALTPLLFQQPSSR